MAFCSRCRRYVAAEDIEVIQNSAWCPHCDRLVSVSLCQGTGLALGVVLLLSLCSRIIVS